VVVGKEAQVVVGKEAQVVRDKGAGKEMDRVSRVINAILSEIGEGTIAITSFGMKSD
tara:strand:- start:148 stop:318 length:171 start_codon:yes stop_codon:yes gene_type:complete